MSGSPIPVVDEGNVLPAADDDVIKDPDTDEFADFAEPAGDLDVLLAGCRIAAGMIVEEDDGGGAVADDLSVNVAWLCCRCSYVT